MKVYQGKLVAPKGAKFAVLVSRFNEFVTGKLLDGCVDALTRHEVTESNIDVVWSPGSFEIPVDSLGWAATMGMSVPCIRGRSVGPTKRQSTGASGNGRG